jgi:hypothetical protein
MNFHLSIANILTSSQNENFLINFILIIEVNGTFRTKKAALEAAFIICGERGIRTPGPLTVNGFQDRRIRPLCHLSGAKIGGQHKTAKNDFR